MEESDELSFSSGTGLLVDKSYAVTGKFFHHSCNVIHLETEVVNTRTVALDKLASVVKEIIQSPIAQEG